MVRRLLSRKAISGQRLESMLASVEETRKRLFPGAELRLYPRISIGACSRGFCRGFLHHACRVCRIG